MSDCVRRDKNKTPNVTPPDEYLGCGKKKEYEDMKWHIIELTETNLKKLQQMLSRQKWSALYVRETLPTMSKKKILIEATKQPAVWQRGQNTVCSLLTYLDNSI